jgi:hypothetical protein
MDGGRRFSYTVQRGLTSGSETTLVSGLTATAYVDATILPGVTYFYRVVGMNPCTDVTTSNEVSVMVAGVLVPQPPGTTLDPLPPDATCCDGVLVGRGSACHGLDGGAGLFVDVDACHAPGDNLDEARLLRRIRRLPD